jgi:hypothetical protein
MDINAETPQQTIVRLMNENTKLREERDREAEVRAAIDRERDRLLSTIARLREERDRLLEFEREFVGDQIVVGPEAVLTELTKLREEREALRSALERNPIQETP